ncbi:MAG: hypothetical protein ABEK00_03730 [Candidatus Nanohaloarchaea archaeon]
MVDVVNTVLVGAASLAFLATIYFTYQLSQETHGGKYWLAFVVAAIGLGAHEWLKIVDTVLGVSQGLDTLIRETGIIVGAVALAYGSYGIHRSVVTVKQQMSGSDDG